MLPLPYPNLINGFLEASHSTQFIKLFLKQLIVRGSNSTDPYFSQFLTSILKIIYNNPTVFDQNVSENIVLQLSTFIIQFQPPALALFGAISNYISDSLLNSMIHSMVSGIKKIILQEPTIKIEIPSSSQFKSIKIDNSLQKPVIDFRFPKIDAFQNISFKRNDNFPESEKLINFIGTKAAHYLTLIADSFYSNQKLSSLFINNFLKNIKATNDNPQPSCENDNSYSNNDCLNFIASAFVIHEKIKSLGVKTTISPKAIQCLSPLYDPIFSLFDFTKDEEDENKSINVKYYYIFSTLRRYALEIAKKSNPNVFYTIISLVSNYPLLLDEVLSLIMSNSDNFYEKIVQSPTIIRIFLRISYNYQVFSFSEQNSDIIEIVRSRLFQFFAYFCTQDSFEVTNFIFTDPESTDLFLSFTREKKLEPFVLQTISQFASNQNARDVENLMNCVFKLIKYYIVITEKEFDEYKDKTIILLTKLMNTVNLISAHRVKYQSEMIPEICGLMCSLSTKFDADNESQNLVQQSIMFVTAMTSSFTITDYEVDCFVSILSKFKRSDSDFLNGVYANLVQLLAGQSLSTISSTFIIQQPEVIKLLIRVYLDTAKFPDVAGLLISLCHFSFKNIQVCCKKKIDSFILKMLDEVRKEGTLDESVIKLLLSIFNLITSYKTDVKTVFQYISLFSPIDDNHHISRYQPVFLDTMKSIIDDSLKGPLKYLPLNGLTVTSQKTDFPGIEHGLTFTSWLYIEHNGPDYQPSLFTIRIGKMLKINLSLSGKIALSLVDDTNKEVTGKMMSELPTGMWVFFVYSINLKPEGIAQVHFFINLEEAGSFKIQNLVFDFTNTKVNLIVGGGNVSFSSNIGKMASASFSPLLTNDQLRNIYENGICRYEPQFSFNIYDFFLSFNPHGVYSIPAFMRKLIKQCSLNVLFPLLQDPLVTFQNGNQFNGQFEQTLLLFSSILPFSFDLQKNFCDIDGPALLGYLIQSRWTQQFTYKTYVKFYQLLENIKYDDLQIQMFKFILINFNILCLIEGDFHMRIIRHWEQTLYSTFGTLSKATYNFHYLLSALRSFYWYEPIEPQALLTNNRKEFNVDFCRKKIQNILMKYIDEDGLEADQFLAILSHIIGCKDVKQSVDLMNFLLSIIYSFNDKFKFKFESIEFQPYLTSFFLIQNKDANILSISIIAALKSNNLVSDKYILDFIDGLILILPTDSAFPFQELFSTCFEEKNSCSALYPLCCILAIKLKGDFLSKMIQDLKVEYGWVWPCTMTVCADVDQKRNIFNFLISTSDEKRWIDIFVFFDLLYLDPELNEEVKSIFISTLCNCILKKVIQMAPSSLNAFYKFAEFFILFRNVNSIKKSKDIKNEFAYPKWNKKILKLKLDKLNYEFGLRIDSDGKWKDLDLSKSIISALINDQNQESIKFILLLISYIKQYSKDEDVKQYIAPIQMNKTEKEKFLNSLEKSEVEKNFFDGNSHEKFINSEFSDFLKRFSNISSKFFSYAQHREKTALHKITPDLDKIGNISLEQFTLFNVSHNRVVKEQEMKWKCLWYHLTLHCGPWENNSNIENNKEELNRFVRDINSCFGFVPFKIAHDFQPSIYESIARKIKSNVILELACTIITNDDKFKSSFELTEEAIMFRFQRLRSFLFELSTIYFININRNISTLQLFSITGTNICAKFAQDDLNFVIDALEKVKQSSKMPNLVFFFNEDPFTAFNSDDFKKICTKRWSMRKISNYEYLLILNLISGRTFNSSEYYPIIPCLFDSKGKSRKDLSKTVFGTDRYNDDNLPMSKEMISRFFKKFNQNDDSNEKSLEESGETIPEIYSMSELSSPEIAYTNRKVLESDEVTGSLHKWISLIWSSEGLASISREKGFWPLFNGSHASRSKSKSRSFLSRKIGAVSIIQEGEIPESTLSSSTSSAMIYEKSPREYVITMIILQNEAQFMQQQQLGIFIESTVINESRKTFAMKNISFSLPDPNASSSTMSTAQAASSSQLSASGSRSSSFSLASNSSRSTSRHNSFISLSASEPSPSFRNSDNLIENLYSDNFIDFDLNGGSKSVLFAEGLCQFLVTSTFKTIDDDFETLSISTVFALNVSTLSKSNLSSLSQNELIQLYHESQQLKQKQQAKKLQEKQQQKLEKQEKQHQQTSQLMLKRKSISITAVASDGPFVAVGFDNAMLIVYAKWKEMFRTQLYRESITACAISANNHIVVCGMKDCSIVICSLVSGTIVNIIDISPRMANKILISPSWGFINVYCTQSINGSLKDFLHVYTIDGKLIRATDIDFQVNFWYSWKSCGGFDFLAIAGNNGSIYCCENFYINSIQKMLSTNGDIIAFHFSNETSMLSALLSNGELFMIPFSS